MEGVSTTLLMALVAMSMASFALAAEPTAPGKATAPKAAAGKPTPPAEATADEVSKVTRALITARWVIDPRCVLPRGDSYDRGVVGDPCIVWDDEIGTWRMFYFAGGTGGATAAMALAASAEQISPGDWRKIGQATILNPEALVEPGNWQKWWVVMDGRQPNRATRIDGKFWALVVSRSSGKHIHALWANRLAGPWTVANVKAPILSPDPDGIDSLHCDTPTAFWFAEQNRVLILYKAYPKKAQKDQPGSPFGSSTVLAWWHPREAVAHKVGPVLRPGQNDRDWNRGWTSGVQLLHDAATDTWYGLSSGSPTPPEDKSHREPAPSVGGWVTIANPFAKVGWSPDNEHSPFRRPEDLTDAEREAGLGVNLWRHHLLATPGGQVRIYFNSGAYGKEQMYSMTIKAHQKPPVPSNP